MRKAIFLTLLSIFLFVVSFGKLSIVTSIPPLGYAVQEIGGTAVNVTILEKPGDDPHSFNLTPRQAITISKSNGFVTLGLEEDKWIADKVKSIDPNLFVVDGTTGFSHLLVGTKGAYNPHVWLDVKLYELMAVNICQGLAKLAPSESRMFSANLGRFLISLNELDSSIRKTLQPFAGRRFVAQHPAWVYFARAYGLGEEYSLESDSDQPIGPREYQNIIDAMKKYGIKTVIGDPVTPSKMTDILSSETGAKVVRINPIYVTDYFDLMKSITNGFAEALK